MFTGIVSDIGEIESLTPVAQGQLHRLRIACGYDRAGIADGASIACNGVCLTVVASGVAHGKTWFDVDAAAETLGMTTAKHWAVGARLNLERALKIGDTTRELARFVAPKGSITLDGVSLTVNTVKDTAFSVLIIPHTLSVTTLSSWRAGSEVNIEVDLMARYAARLTEMK
jgi:riboflavin synthase